MHESSFLEKLKSIRKIWETVFSSQLSIPPIMQFSISSITLWISIGIKK